MDQKNTKKVHKLEFLLLMKGERSFKTEAAKKMSEMLKKENQKGFGAPYSDNIFSFGKEVISTEDGPTVCLKVTAVIPASGVESSRPGADALAKKAKYSSLVEKLFNKYADQSKGIYYLLLDGHNLAICQI